MAALQIQSPRRKLKNGRMKEKTIALRIVLSQSIRKLTWIQGSFVDFCLPKVCFIG